LTDNLKHLRLQATYTDGEREDLSSQKLHILFRNKIWRKQVKLLQGYIPYTALQTGTYYRKAKIRSLINSQETVASDQMTRSLAIYIDQVYSACRSLSDTSKITVKSTNKAQQLSNDRGNTRGSVNFSDENDPFPALSRGSVLQEISNIDNERSDSVLRVKELKLTFVLDPHDRITLLYADSVALERSNVSKINQVSSSSSSSTYVQNEAQHAAEIVSKDLFVLLSQARMKDRSSLSNPIPGIGYEDSIYPMVERAQTVFAHFDLNYCRIVEVDSLIDGLARLGIYIYIHIYIYIYVYI
jgi:hypothetical protein